MFSMTRDLCFILPFTRSHGQEKSSSYYDPFDFRVLLFYGCLFTFIFHCFLHDATASILPVYVDQQWTDLEKDTTQTRGMVIRQFPAVPRRTCITPD